MDACMEVLVDGRVEERRGNVYIKMISTWAGYTTIISYYVI